MSADTQTPSPPGSKLRVAVIVLAVIETLGSLSNLTVFGNLSEYRDGGFAQWVLIAGLVIFPILAIAALFFAIKGDIRRAIMAIAGVTIATWFTDHLPSMFIHGLEFLSGGVTGLYLFAQMVVFPLLAVAALVLARRNQRLVLAAVLASLSTVANVLGVIAFAIGVSMYGF
jgi:hypothetical protein